MGEPKSARKQPFNGDQPGLETTGQEKKQYQNQYQEVFRLAQQTGIEGGIDPELLPYLESLEEETGQPNDQLSAQPGIPLPLTNVNDSGENQARQRLLEVLEISELGGPDPKLWQEIADLEDQDSEYFNEPNQPGESKDQAAIGSTGDDTLYNQDDTTEAEIAVAQIYQQVITRNPEHKIHPTRARIMQVLDWLAHPEREYESIHITGTNGKTSTARMIDQLIQESGLRVGRFTSPHLVSVRERISIDGESISPADFIQAYHDVQPIIELVDHQNTANLTPPVNLPETVLEQLTPAERDAAQQESLGQLSFFEFFTAMGLQAFASAPVDWAVVEVGLGGRWDATNVLPSSVQVITPISLDHEKWLGSTIEEIAQEKAGIIRPNSIVISAPQPPAARTVLQRQAQQVGAQIRWVAPLGNAQAVSDESLIELETEWDEYSDESSLTEQQIETALGNTDLTGVSGLTGFSASEGTLNRADVQILEQKLAVDGQVLTIQTPAATYADIFLPLHGSHQAINAAVALAAVEAINGGRAVEAELVEQAFSKVTSPGRCQVVRRSPTILVDAAHNPGGAVALRHTLEQSFRFKHLVGVFSAMQDKAVEAVLGEMEPVLAEVVVTPMPGERAMPLKDLAATAVDVFGVDRVQAAPSLPDALDQAAALAEADADPAETVGVIVFGSVALAGQTIELLSR